MELMSIERGDLAYPTFALDERIPKIIFIVTDRRDHSHTGNHDAWVRHDNLFWALVGFFLDIFYRFADRGHFLSVFIRDLDPEFLFQSHHELNRVQRVGSKIIHERCGIRYFLWRAAQQALEKFPFL